MAKKEPTAKQLAARKANAERLKAMHAQKKLEKEAAKKAEINEQLSVPAKQEEVPADSENDSPTQGTPQPVAMPAQGVSLTQDQFQMMLDALTRKDEKDMNAVKHEKIIVRFPIEKEFYKNPVEELYDLPELRRFSMRDNFVIEWTVIPVKYETAQGQWFMEPKFELTLKMKQLDEFGNEVIHTNEQNGDKFYKRPILGRANFFNDPPADIVEADQAGVSVDDLDKPEFQEKMRMHRYKLWLTERLSPRRPEMNTSSVREEVIGGKVYQIDNSSRPL